MGMALAVRNGGQIDVLQL